jgi:hypothetical protein
MDEGELQVAYLQERMVHYLICDPHLFIAEERRVQYGPDRDRDVWWIDALIADPWKKTFYLGEATYNLKPSPLAKKVARFYEIQEEVVGALSLEGLEGWSVRPWLFIRKDAVAFLLSRIPSECFPKITNLEETAYPWIYEAKRRKGEEPNKLYPGVDERYQN